MRPAVFVILVVHALHAQTPAPASARAISGQVSDARDNAPLRRARVTATSADSRQERFVFTGDDGRFLLADAPDGALTLKVTKAAYAAAQVIVPPGPAGAELRVALARGAAIAGRIIDEMGPVGAGYVTARLLLPDGTPSAARSARFYAQTNRLGEYRLGGLPAGEYEVTGLRRSEGGLLPAGTADDALFGSRRGFDIGRTVALSLRAGDEAQGIDFAVPGATSSCATGPSARPAEGTIAGRIEGRVTSASGEPLPCAIVRIIAPSSPVPQVFTDRQGAYVIDGLPSGTFVVMAMRQGYLPRRYGQRDPSDVETPLTLRGGDRRQGIDFTLLSESVVTGSVADEHGEPMEGVSLSAVRVWRSTGQPFFMPIPIARSDDRGRYRLVGVPPGDYVVVARANAEVWSSGRPRGYASTYYPGTTDLATALPVAVVAGRDVEGVDVVLRAGFAATVTGTILDPSGQPFAGSVVLTPRSRVGDLSIPESRSTQVDSHGTFLFRNVPRGDYVVKAPGSAVSGSSRFAMQYVTVLDNDPSPLQLQLTEGARVEGRFIVEAAADANLAGLTVSFLPADPDYTPVGGFTMPVFGHDAERTFRMTGLIGPARMTVPPLPGCETCYLKSAVINGVDAVDTPFDFGTRGGTYRDAQIVVSDAGATIEARVVDERAPLSSFAVVVIPAPEDLRFQGSRYSGRTKQGADGSLRIAGLPPGDYLIAAVRRIETSINVVASSDADLLAFVAARGSRVTLAERERRTIDLTLLAR
jgi:hypothetical protein